MQAPIIHLNGSSKQRLMDQLVDAGNALNAALVALYDASPHGRDYYPLGDQAFRTAATEHTARIAKVREVYDEISKLILLVDEQPGQYKPR